MSDIIEKLVDMHSQATVERSHFYVGLLCVEAIDEIEHIKADRDKYKKQRDELFNDLIDHHNSVLHTQEFPSECTTCKLISKIKANL